MKKDLLGTSGLTPSFYLDAEEKKEEISDSDKRMDRLMDMIGDACAKLDAVGPRMDSMEEKFRRMDSAKKDEDEIEEKGEPKEPVADKRKDSEEESKEEKKEEAKDSRKDEDGDMMDRKDEDEKSEKKEEKKETAEADSVYMTKAEAAALQAQIAALSARAPQIISDSDRERFAAIQERAEPVFQAFGDRAPGPLEGETPTQYKRRLGGKLKVHSPTWKDVRLSGMSDEVGLDVALGQIYADAISAGKRGTDVPKGHLRPVVDRKESGHTHITYIGDTDVMTREFSGNLQRA